MKYSSAGVLFTNGTHILGGYQPKKEFPCISGIGGKRELRDTSFLFTAMRECLEELFAIPDNLSQYIELIQENVTPLRVVDLGGYINSIYSFIDLERMMDILHGAGVVSPLYPVFPRTLNELVYTRRVSEDQEITHLAILPSIPSHGDYPFVSREFIKDMKYTH